MSKPRSYGLNGRALYTSVVKPMYTWLTYTVNAADTGGLGVTSVKSNGFVESVFMHTSQTPGSVNGITNPNPVVGYALITLKTNFNTYLGLRCNLEPPTANTSTTSTTAGNVYVITALGTATLAQWQAAGLPAGFTPTLGQTFVAKATGTIGGSAHVGTPGVPVITHVNVVGDPTTTVANANVYQYAGAQVVLQFAAATSSSVTTLAPTAPADGTIVRVELCYDGSSVTIGTGGL